MKILIEYECRTYKLKQLLFKWFHVKHKFSHSMGGQPCAFWPSSPLVPALGNIRSPHTDVFEMPGIEFSIKIIFLCSNTEQKTVGCSVRFDYWRFSVRSIRIIINILYYVIISHCIAISVFNFIVRRVYKRKCAKVTLT